MTPDEYGFWLFWTAIEGAKDDPAIIVGGIGVLAVAWAVIAWRALVARASAALERLL